MNGSNPTTRSACGPRPPAEALVVPGGGVSSPPGALEAQAGHLARTSGRKRGRPKTKITLDAEQLVQVEQLATAGHSEAAIASALGISERSLRNVMQRDERARGAWESGRGALAGLLLSELVARALDRSDKSSAILLIYATKALLHLRDVGDVPGGGGDGGHLRIDLRLPKALPIARYAEQLEHARRRLAALAPDGGAVLEAEVVTDGA
ncbi:MAG: hypothetical protein F9K18_01130 [Thermoanaerobaculia bacterium]|nr:MAG: hypothetical protein F9K18_01130 [Thermoanaerobaculia bacterium]